MRRIVRITTTFAIILVAYWAYALAIVPLIEPPAGKRWEGSSTAPPGPPVDRLAGLREMFRPGDWELQEKTKILESDQVKLLVQDYATVPGTPKKMELHPCTIIFTPNGAAASEAERARQAIILQAPAGALLEFYQPLDLRRGSIGRLKAGRLGGRITIRSQGASPGPEDDLRVITSDIQFTEERIWSAQPVEFALGKSHGRGAETEIKFTPSDDLGGGGRHGLNVAGIESFEVRRLERLHLEPADAKPGRGAAAAPAGPAGAASQLPIEVTCRGPFRFDVGRQTATFEDQVDVLRIHPDGPCDQINGEVLAIQFARRREEAAVPPGSKPSPAPKNRSGQFDLEARRVEARGHPVVIRSPSQNIEGRGERVEYDLQTGQLVLEAAQEAFLKQGINEIHARRVEYQAAEQGRLGQAKALGPGWLRGQMNDRPGAALEARWTGQLRLRPDEHKQQVISLIGDAELKYGALGRLSGGEIHFWLIETPEKAAPATTAAPAAAGPRFHLQPDRMLARQNVHLDSNQLSGAVNQLEVWFESPPTVPARRPPQTSQSTTFWDPFRRPDRLAIRLARQVPAMLHTVLRPGVDEEGPTAFAVAASPPQAGGAPSALSMPGAAQAALPSAGMPLGRRFHIEGSLLRAKVLGLTAQAEISELIVEGSVRFVEQQTEQAGDKPMVVTGDRIHVVEAGKPHAAVAVTGNPAHFEGRGIALEGPNINLNAGTNRLWIEGPGRTDLPMDRDLQGQPAGNQGRMSIQWQNRMALDGRIARFEESVIADTRQQQIRTDTLEAVFREPIRFGDPKNQPRPEIEQVICRGRVLLEGRELDAAGQTSVERIQVNDLAINLLTGAVRAAGPGRVITVRRQSADLPNIGPNPVAPAPPNGPGAGPLVCVDVRFQREITGNLQIRQMVFHERVRVLYAPVSAWDARLDDDNPEALGPHGLVLQCDQLAATQLTAAGTNARAWGLEATGNARAEGQGFTARAARITYDQTKGLLVLEGDGRADATLFLEDPQHPGQRPTAQQSQWIKYWPATGRFTLGGFSALETILPAGKPNAR